MAVRQEVALCSGLLHRRTALHMTGRIYDLDSPEDKLEGDVQAAVILPENPWFEAPSFEPPRLKRLRPTSFLLSVILHLGVGAGVWVLDDLLPALKRPEQLAAAPPEIRVMRVIALSPALLYPVPARPSPAAAKPEPAATTSQQQSPQQQQQQASQQTRIAAVPAAAPKAAPAPTPATAAAKVPAPEPPSPTPAAAPPKLFRTLPVIAKKTPTPTSDLLIQPDIPELPNQEIRAPEMLLVNDVRNQRRTFIRPPDAPRQAKMPAQIMVDAEAPKLGADPNGIMARAVTPQPLLTTPKAARFPVAVPQADAPPQNIATAGGEGRDLPTIISLPSQPVPRYDQTVLAPAQSGPGGVIGPGVRPGELTGGGGGGGGNSGGGSGVAGSAGGGIGVAGGVAGPGGRGAGVAPAMPMAQRGLLRIERPKSGRYDVAITNAESGVPGSSGLLKGRPVYTVYVPVGLAKDWILQYAQANSGAGPRNGTVVTLEMPTPLAAPYAFMMLRPPVVRVTGNGRYGFVHAVINTSGKFEDLRVVGPYGFEDPEGLLRSLGQWEFRPATKDGAAVAVEVLLCVPNS